MHKKLIALAMGFAASMAMSADDASGFPSKPIKIVVPFAPGGASDVLTRKIGEKLAHRLGQPVIVDNRPGANTVTATLAVLQSPADGYTLYSTNTTLIQLPYLGTPRYSEEKDFTPITQYSSAPLGLVVPAENPAKNIQELVAWLKARPGKTSYATAGAGGSQHIYSEAFKRAMGVDSIHIPYKGETPLLTDFLGGRIDWYIATPISILPHVKSGKVRFLAFTGETRVPISPETPTFKEVGVADLVVVGWYGMFAARQTPKPIVEKISNEVSAIVRTAEISAYMSENGLIPTGLGAADFNEKMPYFRQVFHKMIKENNITLE